jgi:PAS domain S-box-containing protein
MANQTSRTHSEAIKPQGLNKSGMSVLIHAHDWSGAGLGPVPAWPLPLRTAVGIMLSLPTPAMLLWGPNLIQIYNDACRELILAKHPACLGQPVSQSWPEIWDFLEPVCDAVMQRGESFMFEDKQLVIERSGRPEEAFFKLTYSAVPADGGDVGDAGSEETDSPGGVLVTITETTGLVRARVLEAERARLEEALQAKRIKLLEEVFHNAPSFLHVLRGPEFVFELANDAYYQLVGHRELIGRPLLEALPEVMEEPYRQQLTHVMTTGEPFVGCEVPVNLVRTPGAPPEKHFMDLVYLPLCNEDGTYQCILGHGVDVTAHVQLRKQAEQALREREERFRRAMEIETIGIVFFNAEGRITSANEAFREMSGFKREEGREELSGWDEAPPGDWKEWISSLPHAVFDIEPGQCVIPQEREFARGDGSRWCALILSKKLNEREAVQYVLDITGRKRAEQALRESEARFRAMAEASPALTWRVDAGGNAVYLNQRFRELIGMTLEELMPAGWRCIIHPDDAKRYLAAFEEALRKHSRFQQRVRIRTANGEWHWLISYALPWFTANDEYAGHAGVSIDITDAVTAESALLEADRRKDEFLATLAHELRNPLGPISNGLALLARPGGAAALPRLLPVIIRQVRYIERLVDDLLEVSRITSGKIELRQSPMRLATALRGAIDASMPLINEKEHELTVFIPERPLAVYADPVRLAQVFTNLLNNAARYTKKGGHIWLTARQEGDEAVVSVRDNGMGVLPGMLPRIFDMFAQERRNGIGNQEGLGIGLSLVHRLVQMHGGTVEARSEGRDAGSEFIVRLPLCDVSATESPDSEKAGPPPLGLRVLVVDDNRDAAEILAMLLESIGVNAQAVHGGPAALAAIPNYQPNVILMDIGMPGMDGHEVARRIRGQPQFNGIKLVALTGWGQEKDRRDSSKAGFDYHLTKPVDFKVLKDLIIGMQNAGLTQP